LITEADPTLAVVTLGAYKYATFFQVSGELATDGHADLLGFLARQSSEALAQAFGAHLMTGTGSGQPTGALTTATAGITGPTGTATSFGVQATAGMGTDLLNSLYGSVAEPYTLSPATAFLLRNATRTAIANLKTSAGEPVGTGYLNAAPAPFLVDPFVSAMGASAESVVFGDWSRYVVRIAGGLRYERSDDFGFQNDLVSFRAIIRLDGALVDANALKTFTHSAT
jgi:HK97 family phage major capsid protein